VIPPPRRSVEQIVDWAASECSPGSAVLNIGAGSNQTGPMRPLLRRSPYLVGVDPDPSIKENRSLDERHEMSIEDFSSRSGTRFDLALAIYVLEHVADPAGFTAACAKLMKPGAPLFGVTLNVNQYFGATTWATSRLGCTDWALTRLKGRHGHPHHFPVVYRMNSVRTISRLLANAGFRSVEFRCYDATERYQWYLPSHLKWFAPIYTRVAYSVGSPTLMGHLAFRAVR
jgi:SAM-dependent methyltransferase